MKKVGYILFLGVSKFIGWLPMPVLYGFSWIIYVVLYYITGYRRKVTADNLVKSFPEKGKAELARIEKLYYKHLSRLMMEVIYMKGISAKNLERRVYVKQPELLNELALKGKKVMLLCGHFGNWEWAALRLAQLSKVPFFIAYKPLSNQDFDKYYYSIRKQFGNQPLTMNLIPRELLSRNGPSTFCFMADQTPSNTDDLWIPFFHRDTLFFGGVEKLAIKTDAAVVFGKMVCVGNGHYEIELELMTENAGTLPPSALMTDYVQRMEAYIREYPWNWLWSHRRWKHQRKNAG
jgi:KDO2-lipid IV(A) lauroyltransferase